MSAVKCREAHGGKFTRPKALWKPRARATHTSGRTIVPSMAMPSLAAFVGSMAGYGQPRFKQRKAG